MTDAADEDDSEDATPARPPIPPKPDPLEELAKLAAQLRPESRPRWRPSPLGAALVGLLLVAGVTAALTRSPGRRSSAGRPLLPPPDLTADTDLPPWRAVPPPATSAPTTAPAKPMSDARAIDLDLEREFSGGGPSGRPTIPGPARTAIGSAPSWVKEVAASEPPDGGTGPRKLGGRYGDHLRVQLLSALDSRLCGTGAVEGVLVRAYLVNGAVVLPPRTLLFGECGTRGDRFLLTFTRVRLPDGTEAPLEAAALDAADGKPGVLASRRLGGDAPAPRDSVGGDIARGAASTVLSAGTAAAGLPGQVVNGAGQTAINTRATEPAAPGDALLLDGRPVMDLFVRQAF